MRVYLNPGHAAGGNPDPGAVNRRSGLRECDIALAIGTKVKGYLEAAGCETKMLQSDNLAGESPGLPCVTAEANAWPADIFVSLHCNAANGAARGTETLVYGLGGKAERLARCIQRQVVDSVGTVDRGLKERRGLIVLKDTSMPAALVEMAFIDQDEDAALLLARADDFARAIARGVTDYGRES